MKEELLKIIKHYGVNNQQRKLQEEIFELQEAITKYNVILSLEPAEYFSDASLGKNHIAEEIADVCVMLREFMEYYDITQDEISILMEYKINRQIERIANEV